MSALTANAKRAHAILETLGFWSSSWERSELCAVTGRCWYQELVRADGTTEPVANKWDPGIYSHPHLNLYQDTTERHFGQAQATLCLFPASISRAGECCSPSWLSASSTSWTSHETHFLSCMSDREQRGWAWSPRHGLQGHSRSDHVCEAWSCPAQRGSGSQLQWHSVLGSRMLKDGASWVYSRTSELKLLGFLPWAQVPGHTQSLPGYVYMVLVCTLLHHACSSWTAAGGQGTWGGSQHTIYWPLILDPVKFHPEWEGSSLILPSAVCQWRTCWLSKAFSSSWLTAPFWSNLLTLFLIFLNSKH